MADAYRRVEPLGDDPAVTSDTVARRAALVIGIDYYETIGALHGCVADARGVSAMLEKNGDGTANFGRVTLRTASAASDAICRGEIKDGIEELFAADGEVALLYFAGHGHVEATGGYLCASETRRGDDGLALSEVLTLAHRSPARNRIIVLDSCHSGVAGNMAGRETAELSDGMTVLTASTAAQYASEEQGSGVFTTLFIDALDGGAANLVGKITPGSVYAHVDQSLGPWKQRPVFKTNVSRFISLRTVPAPIALSELRMLPQLFPAEGFEFALDPSFEPEERGRPSGAVPPNPVNVATFAVLQRFNRVNLLRPVGAAHMWNAAIECKACRLTVLGEHYRRLVLDELI